ncbi:cytidine deaminase [Drosophila sulfurigaster albostrigata]|uniref:cytidine deaminase n=1 Tax=Drosophila sulfurigaster albostrigata TaxID=89887 RepID=UPI002D21DB8E|nr:cytidine deaminase [Drosophila sulfurigaster albostrigata]
MTQVFINGARDETNVREFDTLDSSIQELIRAANEARNNAYCPYSNFAVGAALRTSDGAIYTGCNIENGAYAASICAERTAAVKAISEGKRDFVACAVVAQQDTGFTTPCGVCRQFLAEFVTAGKDIPLYAAKPSNLPLRVLCTSVLQLLPNGFTFHNGK